MTMLERIAAARDSGDLDALVQAIPYARFLGLTARLDGDSALVTEAGADSAARVMAAFASASGLAPAIGSRRQPRVRMRSQASSPAAQ